MPTQDGWSFRRLIDVFHKVCNGIAYAHSRGVVHRDIKPENVMLGSYGQVYVVDWGIAKLVGRTERSEERLVETKRSSRSAHQTRTGQIAGTPAYMAPEQARGQTHLIDARTDVYALGAMYMKFSRDALPTMAAAPIRCCRGSAWSPSLRAIELIGEPTLIFDVAAAKEVQANSNPNIPEELLAACEKAMARAPADRFQNANELAEVIKAWLEGSKKREQALVVVEEARNSDIRAAKLLATASKLRSEAETRLMAISEWESEKTKAPCWEIEDRALALEQEAKLLAITREQKLHAALTYKSDLPEAHAELLPNTKGNTNLQKRIETMNVLNKQSFD